MYERIGKWLGSSVLVAGLLASGCGGSDEDPPEDSESKSEGPVEPRFSVLLSGESYPFGPPTVEEAGPAHWRIRASAPLEQVTLAVEIEVPREAPPAFHCSEDIGASMRHEVTNADGAIVWSSLATGGSCTIAMWTDGDALVLAFAGNLIWYSSTLGPNPVVLSDGHLKVAHPDQ